MNSTVNNKDEWEELINAVDKSNIPIEFINSIVIQLHTPTNDPGVRDINVKELRDQGLSEILIEELVRETILNLKGDIEAMNFYVDVDYVAETVQHQTNLILTNI